MSKFLISDGINTFSVATNLDPSQNLKTDSLGDIISVPQLAISDVSTLQSNLDGKLLKSSNLTDLTDPSVGRSSLGLGSVLNDISTIQGVNATQSADITAIQTVNATQTADITAIQTVNATQTADITAIQGVNATQTADITSLQTSVATKMTKIASTDSAIPVFNGTGGEVKNTGVLIDATNNVTGVNELKLNGALTPAKLTTSQRDLLIPVQGNIIYNTTTNNQEIYDGVAWGSSLEASPITGAQSTGIYTGTAAAISLRKVNSAYTGACCQIRRSDINTTAEIGFDAGGILDKVAFDAHVSGNPGYISIWYDQSGNGCDFKAHENNVTRQALIVWTTINSIPNIPEAQFNGAVGGTSYTCVKNVGQMNLTNGVSLAFQTTFKMTAINTLSFIYSTNADGYFEASHSTGTSCTTSMHGANKTFTTPNVLNTGYKRWVSYHTGGQTNLRIDSVNNTPQNDALNTAGTGLILSLGCRSSTGQWRFQGSLNEFIVYNTKIADTLLSNIEQDEKDLWVDGNLASNGMVSYVNTYDLLNVTNNLKLTSTIDSTTPTNGALVTSSAGFSKSVNIGETLKVNGNFYLPFYTTTTRNLLTPQAGMVIFNTTLNVIQLYSGSEWRTLLYSV